MGVCSSRTKTEMKTTVSSKVCKLKGGQTRYIIRVRHKLPVELGDTEKNET